MASPCQIPVDRIIYGRHPVLAALRQADTPLEEIVIAQGLKGSWVDEARRLARSLGVRWRVQERAALDRLAGTGHHQGIVARAGSYRYHQLDELLEHLAGLTEIPLLVAADGITDPMNLGNLSRSALAAGAHGLIIPKDRAVGVTPVVLKAGAGALEYLPVYRVINLAESLMRLKEAGLWVIGTDAQAPQSLYDTDLTTPLVVVIGSEGKGLRPRVRQQCDILVAIPLAAPEIGSLNAASAGAVMLFEARRQRLQRNASGQS
jgi:23S rRNA (guanosine2251-2'-O)-methyltransferase